MPIPPSLADRAGALLTIAARTGQELAGKRLAPMGLTVRLCGVLNLLGNGPISQQELGEQLGIDRTTVVELIDELERQGVVVRRRNARFAARLINPLVLAIAGRRWMPILGVLHHQGRQSGRMYATPLGMRPLGNTFLMPRTFGKNSAWCLNVQAAGWCVVTYKGRDYRLIDPEVVDYTTPSPALPRYQLLP